MHVKDALAAAPLEKKFELYKPQGGGPGGFVRVRIDRLKPLESARGDKSHDPK